MPNNKLKILITGAAGFIGFHLTKKLHDLNYEIVGIDNLNNYYDINLKNHRLQILNNLPYFSFHQISLENKEKLLFLFEKERFDLVVSLAAQAGVRYSIENPDVYIQSNINGFLNLLEACRLHPIQHLVFASSSSVYGANSKMPFSVHDNVDHPMSLYAATKKANELMAHTYASLYSIPSTGLRFFTVYGPYSRPDMAFFLFTKAIIEGKPINVFNNGQMERDFTYVDDIVDGVSKVLSLIPKANPDWNRIEPDPSSSFAPYKIYNIGNNKPVNLLYFIECIEKCLNKKAIKIMLPLQPGDVPSTFADIQDLVDDVGFEPKTSIEKGVSTSVDWFLDYYNVKI